MRPAARATEFTVSEENSHGIEPPMSMPMKTVGTETLIPVKASRSCSGTLITF